MGAVRLPKPQVVSAPIPKFLRSIDRRRYAIWFWGGEFTTDWFSSKIPVWRRVLGPWRDQQIRILEIGSWEGRSALFFLKFFRRSHVTCIDTFAGSEEHFANPQTAVQVLETEARFDRNLAPFAKRIDKIKSASGPALEALTAAGRRFELAYIDGSHLSADVLNDSMQVWPLVVPGGVVIWDDYAWAPELPPHLRPQPAIDYFLAQHPGQFRLLVRGYQMIVERLG
jgi:hypothetical protein